MDRKAITLPGIGKGRVTRKRYAGGTAYRPVIKVHIWDGGDEFTHPSITIKWISVTPADAANKADPEAYVHGYTVTLTFQRHFVEAGRAWDRPSRGFLRGAVTRYGARPRCASYGGDISGSLDERFAMEWTLALVERATEALRADERAYRAICRKGGEDKMLHYVAGFQRLGLEVSIYNDHCRPTVAHRRAA